MISKSYHFISFLSSPPQAKKEPPHKHCAAAPFCLSFNNVKGTCSQAKVSTTLPAPLLRSARVSNAFWNSSALNTYFTDIFPKLPIYYSSPISMYRSGVIFAAFILMMKSPNNWPSRIPAPFPTVVIRAALYISGKQKMPDIIS